MFDRNNQEHFPSKEDIRKYIDNPIWDDFCEYIKKIYNIEPTYEFSKCTFEFGWNVKFRKNNKSLCAVYPKENYFTVMIVIGQKEKEDFNIELPDFDCEIQKIYSETKEGNGQKWLMINIKENNKIYEDIKTILEIKYANFNKKAYSK